jgi:hypothetical protein
MAHFGHFYHILAVILALREMICETKTPDSATGSYGAKRRPSRPYGA